MLFTYGLDSIPKTKLGLRAQGTRHSDEDRSLFSCRKYSSVFFLAADPTTVAGGRFLEGVIGWRPGAWAGGDPTLLPPRACGREFLDPTPGLFPSRRHGNRGRRFLTVSRERESSL
ncbi:hypothetical protein HNY73_019262 [Argiope bruennichi]|uniref:Uncharacterized protein n=1 Tax=Argiope bruennichi TaxID=94029 RepID=A0A8T0EFV3_ARGBR|nr:hypothetical protein HNY73_019262 [Argiope bruennichi]